MAIIKRYIKKNGQRKVCYQAQVYVKGFRLKCKTFKNKTEACVWHDKQKEQLLKNPSELYQEKQSVFFSECFKQYLGGSVSLIEKGYTTRLRSKVQVFYKGAFKHSQNRIS